jgi:hypothetical protein
MTFVRLGGDSFGLLIDQGANLTKDVFSRAAQTAGCTDTRNTDCTQLGLRACPRLAEPLFRWRLSSSWSVLVVVPRPPRKRPNRP